MDDDDGYSAGISEEAHTYSFSDYPMKADGSVDETGVYQAFVMARRRWRSLVGRPRRKTRFRRKGKAKGKKGKRFQRRSGWSFLNEDGDYALCPMCIGQAADYQETFAMGKAKGKNPRGKRQ